MKKHFKRAFAFMLAAILCFSSVSFVSAADAAFATPEEAVEQTVGAAVTTRAALVKAVRENLLARKTSFTISYDLPEGPTYDDDFFKYVFYDAASEYTGSAVEGDYLKWSIKSESHTFYYSNKGDFSCKNVVYRTTTAQEETLTNKVNSILSGLALTGKSQYQKALAIKDYVCNNVSHDEAGTSTAEENKTAYGALIKGKTTILGYAMAFYRLATMAGLECRILTSAPESPTHTWNIVKIDGKFYNIDVSFSDYTSGTDFFLKGEPTWNKLGYVRDEVFRSAEFKSRYPMSQTDYTIPEPAKVSISGAKVTTKSASYAYTGNPRRPEPTVTLNGKTLVYKTDYTVKYSNNTNVGTATITITGTGNYTGTAKGSFKLTRASIANATVKTKSASYSYTGSARCPKPVVTLGDKTLTLDTDYTLSYKNNVNVGTATVTVKGKGNYTGTAKGTFKLTRASLASATVKTQSASYKITGKARCPKPVVKLGTKTLTLDVDYTLSYKNNVNVGTATVIVTGKGNYSGTAKGTFKLVK